MGGAVATTRSVWHGQNIQCVGGGEGLGEEQLTDTDRDTHTHTQRDMWVERAAARAQKGKKYTTSLGVPT